MSPEDRSRTPAEIRRLEQAEVDPDLLAPRGVTRPRIVLAIAAGGVGGTAARYGVGRIIHAGPGSFPSATFAINLSGSFVLGMLLTCAIERWPPSRYVRPFTAIGFLGSYTTFSTYMTEADVLIKDGHADIAALYVAASLLLGLLAVYAGIVVARLWPTTKGNR